MLKKLGQNNIDQMGEYRDQLEDGNLHDASRATWGHSWKQFYFEEYSPYWSWLKWYVYTACLLSLLESVWTSSAAYTTLRGICMHFVTRWLQWTFYIQSSCVNSYGIFHKGKLRTAKYATTLQNVTKHGKRSLAENIFSLTLRLLAKTDRKNDIA